MKVVFGEVTGKDSPDSVWRIKPVSFVIDFSNAILRFRSLPWSNCHIPIARSESSKGGVSIVGKIISIKPLRKKKWLHRKPICFAVKMIAFGVCPKLDRNPGNFFAQMTENDRTEEWVEALGMLWAETIRKETKTSDSAKVPTEL